MNLLTLKQVKKSFGSKQVLKNLELAVPKGSIYGFIGQNGAGKTTTMKLILGLLKIDSGEILIEGEQVAFGNSRTNRLVGYLPDVPVFYGYLTAKEYLFLCGELQKMEKRGLEQKVTEMLEFVGLKENSGKIQGFSRGMKQRLGVAQALLGQPQLLICDEPTSALDPVGRLEILELFQKVSQETTVLFSTHILNDVEKICDHVAILHNGVIAEQGELTMLKQQYGQTSCLIEWAHPEEQTQFRRTAGFDCQIVNETTIKISLEQNERFSEQIFQKLDQLKLVPLRFEVQQPSLEEVFLEVIR